MQPAIAEEVTHQASTVVDVNHVAQAEATVITSVQVAETATGLTIRLEAADELAAPETLVVDNALVAEIPNARLSLADGDEFVTSDPADGIAQINVTSLPDNRVQIVITGTDAAPDLEISTAATGLIVSVTPGIPTAQAPDQAPEDDALRLVVTGAGEDGYFTPDASTATRTDTPLRDIPNSIQVIPRQVIEDQQAIGLEEVLENAAGVSYLNDNAGRGQRFAIRGFDGAPVLRDGFRQFGIFTDSAGAEVANLEQVEVLRGPAAVLYGQVEPGGIINQVTKKPLSEPYYNLQLQGGTRGLISPSIDLSGPLSDDGQVLYRLNALYRREESFRDLDNDFERFFIAPTLTWLINDSTDLTVNLEYIKDDEPYETGTLAFGDGIADVPTTRVFSDPDSTVEQDFFNVGYTLEHRFSDDWKLRNQFRYTYSSFDFSPSLTPIFLDETTGLANRFLVFQEGNTETYSLYTNVQGEFNTGSIGHTVLLGVDVNRSNGGTFSAGNFSAGDIIDIFEDTVDVPFPPEEDFTPISDRETEVDQLGIYLQDQIDILDNLILVAGLRYDTASQEVIQTIRGTERSSDESAVTPRVGIVYQPIEPISLYANYSRSFAPDLFATDIDGNLLDAEEGEGFEVGIRGEIIRNRLAATLAYFDITKQNVSTRDPADLVPPFASIATGEQRSQGIDFNLTGELLPGWNMVASYAYIDAEVTEDNTDLVGNRLLGIPEHSASLWTTYEIQSGNLQGLGVGLGFNFVGERQGDLANSFELDSYFRTDAAVFYRQDSWQVRLNVDNLFDIDYIESAGGTRTFDIDRGDPLTVRASVEYEF
ncbi:MAG: TonB-dependent siderophore receptor [Cyanobacteria bacterium P01_H01_bin.21]